jgi:hypothetical protein
VCCKISSISVRVKVSVLISIHFFISAVFVWGVTAWGILTSGECATNFVRAQRLCSVSNVGGNAPIHVTLINPFVIDPLIKITPPAIIAEECSFGFARTNGPVCKPLWAFGNNEYVVT